MVTRIQRTEAITYAHMNKALTLFGDTSLSYFEAKIRWEVAYGILRQCGFKTCLKMRAEAKSMDQGIVVWN